MTSDIKLGPGTVREASAAAEQKRVLEDVLQHVKDAKESNKKKSNSADFCSEGCGRGPEIELSPNATGFTCAYCVQKIVAPPEAPKVVTSASPEEKAAKAADREKKKTEKLEKMKTRGRGKGWHLKRLFDHDGKFYSFGKEITEVEAVKIKKELKANPELEKPVKIKRKK